MELARHQGARGLLHKTDSWSKRSCLVVHNPHHGARRKRFLSTSTKNIRSSRRMKKDLQTIQPLISPSHHHMPSRPSLLSDLVPSKWSLGRLPTNNDFFTIPLPSLPAPIKHLLQSLNQPPLLSSYGRSSQKQTRRPAELYIPCRPLSSCKPLRVNTPCLMHKSTGTVAAELNVSRLVAATTEASASPHPGAVMTTSVGTMVSLINRDLEIVSEARSTL